jgi:hypothetical protein
VSDRSGSGGGLNPVVAWVFGLMIAAMPASWTDRMQANVARLRELVVVAVVIAEESETDADRAALVAIGWYESGYVIRARGKLGEVGVWQLMPPAPVRLRDQAREAIARLHRQGWTGYTGEGGRCPCPLAEHRRGLAERLLEEHPRVDVPPGLDR